MQQSLQPIIQPIVKFVGKYHPTIFITLLALLLIGAVASLLLVINRPASENAALDQGTIISGTFDQPTIDRVEKLRDATEAPEKVTFPTDVRTNPFVE